MEPKTRPPIRGRFAPSPSGRMHVGNAFCALLAWLSARSCGGSVILRMEDLDPQRSRSEYAAQIERDLKWLGLTWDEGGAQGGPYPPYEQSRCSPVYLQALNRLWERRALYPCFCSRADLHAANAPHTTDGRVRYDGRCRNLTPEEIQCRAKRRAPALRVRVPEESAAFEDGVCGKITRNLAQDCGDFVVRRSDGVASYQLAVVADDARMGVTQVVRGRDLLESTPIQLYLYRLLGLPAPAFFHIPLLLAPDGRRLSKRDRDMDLGGLQGRGWQPQQVVGLLARLAGLTDRVEPVKAEELIPIFHWDKIPKENIVLQAGLYSRKAGEPD